MRSYRKSHSTNRLCEGTAESHGNRIRKKSLVQLVPEVLSAEDIFLEIEAQTIEAQMFDSRRAPKQMVKGMNEQPPASPESYKL